MFQRKPRRFRHRSNGRGYQSHRNGHGQTRQRSDSFPNGQTRNNFRTTLSVEKLFEKYNSLAKEAMSSGDKTLAENYLQHADHFMRIIDDKNRNRNLSGIDTVNKPSEDQKHLSDKGDINQKYEVKNKN